MQECVQHAVQASLPHGTTRSGLVAILRSALCRNAYNMVINKFGERLYMGLENVIEQHLSTIARKIDAAQGESFLRELKLRWEHHNKSMQMIRDILMVSWSSGRSATEDEQSDGGGARQPAALEEDGQAS